jgi:hypothetical protein
MSTYSFLSPPYDSTNLNDITAVLNQLPDNTAKQITPKDVRDAIYSTWENIIIKPTGITGGYGYIGLDSTQNGLTHSKIYFGKRQFLGVDIMSSTLLNRTFNDSDFFFFNTRLNNVSQHTKISILAGTNSTLYTNAPYIESRNVNYVVGPTSGSYLDLNIINKSTSDDQYGGNINIGTDQPNNWVDGGYVTINGMSFPRYIDPGSTQSNALDGYVLKYNNTGYLTWEPVTGVIDSITSAGTVSITGSPVLINGVDTNFLTSNIPVPLTIGGVLAGTTFSNVNIVDVVSSILYPYLAPSINFSLNITPTSGTYPTSGSTNVIVELGNINTFSYTYFITKRTANITSATSSTISPLPSPLPYTTSINGTLTLANTLADISTIGSKTFTVTISDGTSSVSSSATLTKVLPFFYGATSSVIPASSFNASFAGNLFKNVKTKSDTSVQLVGTSSCIYFAYPVIHGLLSQIIDNNNFDVTTSFTYSTISLNSPSGYFWGSTVNNYRLYRYTGGGSGATATSIGVPPTYVSPVTYQFKF